MYALSLINMDLILKIIIQLHPAQTWLFLIPCYFELKTICLRFALQSFTIGYFELSLFQFLSFPLRVQNSGIQLYHVIFRL